MGGETAAGISRTEFAEFRNEMRESMQQQTKLMRQMVELQTKHNNLESQVQRNVRDIDVLEQRLLSLEQGREGVHIHAQHNRNLIWLVLTSLIGIAGYVLRGGL